MHIVTLLRDMKEFQIELNIESIGQEMQKDAAIDKSKLTVDVSAEGNAIFEIKISERHNMQWLFQNMFISRKDRLLLSVENIFIKIDDEHIFTFKDVDMQSLPKLDILTLVSLCKCKLHRMEVYAKRFSAANVLRKINALIW